MPKDASWKALQPAFNRFSIALRFYFQNGHTFDASNFDRAQMTFCFSIRPSYHEISFI